MSRFKVFYALAVMIFMSLSAHAVSGSYSDGVAALTGAMCMYPA